MKIWINLNATFDLQTSDAKAYDDVRQLVSNIIANDRCESITFKSGEETEE